jgi:hypothetical protein
MLEGPNRDSNRRGRNFESLVGKLLHVLALQHPKTVKVIQHPTLKLNNGSTAIPDFELVYELPYQIDHRIIECQDRKRSSLEIARKIRDMKAHSEKNRFLFVYKEENFLTTAVRNDLDSDGIVHYNVFEFVAFLNRLSQTLGSVAVADLDFLRSAIVLDEMAFLKRMVPIVEEGFSLDFGPAKDKADSASSFSSPISSPVNLFEKIRLSEKKKDEGMLSSPPNNPKIW